jgi:hypothetical protein
LASSDRNGASIQYDVIAGLVLAIPIRIARLFLDSGFAADGRAPE